MKTTGIILVILAVLSVMLSIEWAEARGNHRGAIDQKWKQVQAEQERQNREWRRIDREAEGLQRAKDDPRNIIRSVPFDGRQSQCP
jgi:hypothetical protein